MREDGWLRLAVTFQDACHAEWALWQLGASAEALFPQTLRAALRDRVTTMANVYEEVGPTGAAKSC